MELRQWRRLTLQCMSLLGMVLLVCLCCSGGKFQRDGAMVHANNKDISSEEGVSIPVMTPPVESATQTEKSEVEEPGGMYVKLAKASVGTAAAVTLTNEYMESTVYLEMKGLTENNISLRAVERNNGIYQCRGKVDARDSQDFLKKCKIEMSKEKEGRYKARITLKTKKLYEPTLYETPEAYYITFQKPSDKYEKIVVIDAGHGGIDEGTASVDGKYQEKKYTLLITEQLKKLLDDSEIHAYYTRLDDSSVSKKDRTQLANELPADLFISIHCNASNGGDTTAYGVEALYSKRMTGKMDRTNKSLARILANQVSGQLKTRNRGVIQREGLYLLHHSKVPTSILEIGYMSNASDLNYIKKEKGQQQIAQGIYEAIQKALK